MATLQEIKSLVKHNKEQLAKEQKELADKLSKINEQLAVIKKQEKQERSEQILQNIDILLQLFPNHTNSRCSDNATQAYEGCCRCHLVEAKKYGYWDEEYRLDLYAVKDN